METEKREKLEAKGWKIGTVQQFLALSDEEMEYIVLKIEEEIVNPVRIHAGYHASILSSPST